MSFEWLSDLLLRCRALVHRRRLHRDLEDELQFHLAARADAFEQSGAHSPEAAEQSRRQFGNPTSLKEACRDMWTFRWIEVLGQDLRYAARMLRRNPGFTTVAILTLALGIGANTAIFSVVDATILRPLPYPEPSRLVKLYGNVKRAQVERRGTSLPDYADWRDQSRSFEAMALYEGGTFTLTGVDEPERLTGEFVAHPYFQMLGVRAALGRTFRPEEDQVPQRDAVVVLSDSLWKRRFGGDASIVGRSIRLNDRDFSVIGVLPEWFRGLTDTAEAWLPLHMIGSAQDFANRGSRGPSVLARLKPGVSIVQAQTEMDGISRRLQQAYPNTNEGRGVEISPLERELLGDLRTPLIVLLVAVGFVLVIACANVANLLLVRAEARQREIAVRTAMGAGRGRVLQQLTTESCLLAFLGAVAGVLLAGWSVPLLLAASPITFPSYIQPGLDLRVMLFTVLITCGAGLLLGLAPAAHIRAGDLHGVLKQSSRNSTSQGGRRFRDVLVIGEIALAMLLLVGAGLLIRTVQHLAAINPGYDPAHVLTLRVSLPRLAPPSAAANATAPPVTPDGQTVVSARALLQRVAAIPSVEAAALGSDVPLTGASAIFYSAEGQPPVTAQNIPRGYVHRVTPDFFKTLRIPFTAGRTFTDQELEGNANVVIVSEGVAKRFWSGQDPLGKRIKAGRADAQSPWLTIVGVVNEMKYRGLPNNPTADPDLFFPFSERQRTFALLVRTPLDPSSLAPSVRGVLRQAEPGAVVFNVSTMEELASRRTSRSRFTGWLMGIFAGSALLLAMIGIYGVMSYAVTRRTQEIGVRMALGAGRVDVLRMVMGSGAGIVALGLGLGMVGAFGVTHLISTLLFGVKPSDPIAFAIAAGSLATVGMIACLVPAARATTIAPATALRNE